MTYWGNRYSSEDARRIIPGRIWTALCCIYIALSFYEGYLDQIAGSNTKYLLLGMIALFLAGYRKAKYEAYHWLMLAWLAFKVASLLWSTGDLSGSDTVSSHVLSQFGMVGFLTVMTIVAFDRVFVRRLIDAALYSSVSLGLLGLFFSHAYLGSVDSRRVLTLFGNQIDPNNLSALYLVGVGIGLYYILYEKRHILLNILCVTINGTAMLLTASRGGLVSLLVLAVCFIVIPARELLKKSIWPKMPENQEDKNVSQLSRRGSTGMLTRLFSSVTKSGFQNGVFQTLPRRQRSMSSIVTIASIIAVMLIVLYAAENYLPQSSFVRLFDISTYGGGSDRDYLWSDAMTLIQKSPLIGLGWGGYESGIHNTYLSMLCDVGFVGALLFAIPVVTIASKAIKSRMPLPIILLAVGLTPSFFIDAINKRFFWNAIIMAVVVLNSWENGHSSCHPPHPRRLLNCREIE